MPRVIVPVTRELLEARRRVRRVARARRGRRASGELVEAAEPRRVSGRGRRLDPVEAARARRAGGARARRARRAGAEGLAARRRRDGRRRLPRRRPAAVPRLVAPGGRARADRQPPRPRARRPRVPASGAAALGRWRGGSAPGPAVAYLLWKPVAVGVLFAGTLGARAALPGRGATTAGSRWCSRCSPARRWRRSSAGAGSATRRRSCRSTSSPASCGRAPTCGATCSPRSPSGCCRWALLAYERGRAGGGVALARGRGGRGAAVRVAAAVAGRDVRVRPRRRRAGARCGRGRRVAAAARDLALPLAATAAPLVYYALLGRYDAAWALAARGQRPAALAVVGAARRARAARAARPRSRTGCPRPDFGAVALRAWPLAALARLLPAVRDVPVPRPPGADAAARRARRARAAGVARRPAGPAAARGGGGRSCSWWSGPRTASRASPTPCTSAASRSR